MKYFFLKTICNLFLVADRKTPFTDKLVYFFQIIATFSPLALVLDGLNLWFTNNTQFFSFLIICLTFNVVVGAWFHHKKDTFVWKLFFEKNLTMWIVLILVYAVLDMLRMTAGENVIGEGFGILIQITTLLWPISKVLKNCFFLSNKQFPPEFMMKRIYDFEKNGNINDLFETDKKEE